MGREPPPLSDHAILPAPAAAMHRGRLRAAAILASMVLASVPVSAQTVSRGPSSMGADRGDRRLFQRFIEDAAVVPGGWIEGQLDFQNLPDDSDRLFIGPLIAFKISDEIEAGLRFGFLRVDDDSGPEGSGLSDIDLYAKYRFPAWRGQAAIGALLKLASGDEEDGLGTGEKDLEIFTAWRADLEAVTLTANVGVRLNGSPDPPVPRTEDSLLLGGALILPASSGLSFVIEATYESERFKHADPDARLTLGFQSLRGDPGGGFRAALAIPLSDGAPDYELIGGAIFVY